MSGIKKTNDDIRNKYHEYLKFIYKNPSTKLKNRKVFSNSLNKYDAVVEIDGDIFEVKNYKGE